MLMVPRNPKSEIRNPRWLLVLIRGCLLTVALAGLAEVSPAQILPPSNPRNPDETVPRGSIEGRVFLPSGQPIETNVKVTLSNTVIPLFTLYTNKHGEFRFTDMVQGVYLLEIVADTKTYELVTKEVWLKRGDELNLAIYLTLKKDLPIRTTTAKTVSVAELNRDIPAAAKRAYGRARARIREGDILGAIEYLKRAITLHPDYLVARNDLGVQYLKLNRFAEAAEQFRWAIEKSPHYFHPRLNLGLVLVEQRKHAEAVEQFRQAVSLDSAHPAAHLWLGVALMETGQLEEAARELLSALGLGRAPYAIARYYLARIYMMRSQLDEARRELVAYLDEAPLGEKAEEVRQLLEQLRP